MKASPEARASSRASAWARTRMWRSACRRPIRDECFDLEHSTLRFAEQIVDRAIRARGQRATSKRALARIAPYNSGHKMPSACQARTPLCSSAYTGRTGTSSTGELARAASMPSKSFGGNQRGTEIVERQPKHGGARNGRCNAALAIVDREGPWRDGLPERAAGPRYGARAACPE